VGIHQQALQGLFGPSEEAEKAFQELSASWVAFQKAGVPTDPKLAYLKPTYDAWVSFSTQWKDGNGDSDALRAMLADARRVSGDLAKQNPSAPPIAAPEDVSFEQLHPQTTAVQQETAPVVDAAESIAKAAGHDVAQAASAVASEAEKALLHLPFWVYPTGLLVAAIAVVVGTRSVGLRVA